MVTQQRSRWPRAAQVKAAPKVAAEAGRPKRKDNPDRNANVSISAGYGNSAAYRLGVLKRDQAGKGPWPIDAYGRDDAGASVDREGADAHAHPREPDPQRANEAAGGCS